VVIGLASDVSCCLFEGGSEVEHIKLPLLLLLHLLLSAILGLHADDPSLEILLHALHDHARPADLALSGQDRHLSALLQRLADQLHRLLHVHVLDPLELQRLLHHWQHFPHLRHQYQCKNN
jgi:hypothetical protein